MMPRPSYTFDAIGTKWTIDTEAPLEASEKYEIQRYIQAFDHAYSRFRDDSLVNELKNSTDSVAFPDSSQELLAVYDMLYELSDGAINPLVGESLERLGYDAHYSLKPATSMRAPDYHGTLTRQGNSLQLHKPAVLDIGAIGKGYLVDAVAKLLQKNHTYYTVDGGGDIAITARSWEKIGLEDPKDSTKVIGAISLQSASICGSGIGKRSWGKGLHHVIDATTGKPASGTIVATWAIAPTTMLADALSTGLFFIPPLELQKKFHDFYYVIMHNNGKVQHNIPPTIGEVFA